MRYLRMYVVINILMAGAICAAEAAPSSSAPATADMGEGVPAGVDEEPPQQMAEPTVAEQPPAEESGTVQVPEVVTQQPAAVESAPAAQSEAAPQSEAAEPEPTIEDAEAVFAEEMVNQPQGMQDLSAVAPVRRSSESEGGLA
jgi:hypothetical protein